jgi:hypothetical protein
MSDFWDENKGSIFVGLIAAFAIYTQLPDIKQQFATNQQIALANQGRVKANQTMIVAEAALKQSKEIANARYDGGCEIITTVKNMSKATTIQEGKPIVSGAYAKVFDPRNPNPDHYVGRDLTVCDLYGATAITEWNDQLGHAVAGSLATTNDRSRMAAAAARKPGINRPGLTN